jgi:hypothetical protein
MNRGMASEHLIEFYGMSAAMKDRIWVTPLSATFDYLDHDDNFLARHDDAPIWFFDHEYCSDERIHDSFDSWLASYFSLDDSSLRRNS